ncbi:hypothetical protein PFISCL1PPCAC_8151, partial [Pristionchus fissidentatus]
AALSVCLVEATAAEKHATNQMPPCLRNSLGLARSMALEYGQCLMNESCAFYDEECKKRSSLPIISHCPSFFAGCNQLAECCP